MSVRYLTEAEFDKEFMPHGAIYEWEQIKDVPVNRVWTVVEGDDGLGIINGIHYVNRLGYDITEVPWVNGIDVIVECDMEGLDP